MRIKLSINGMSCQHCVKHITDALEEVFGVKSVKVSLRDGSAVVESDHQLEYEKLQQVIDEAGYQLTSLENL